MHITFTCEEEKHRGISSNVSSTGLFIKTRKKFKAGLPVNMTVDKDESQKMNLNGVIARTKITSRFDKFENGIGIGLTEVPQAYKDFMEVLFQKHP